MLSRRIQRLLARRGPPRKRFQLFEGTRPIFAQQAGECAVGEQAAGGLAARAVVGFIRGLADALYLGAAHRARLAVAAVYRHAFAEGCDFLGKRAAGLGAQTGDPLDEDGLSRVV